MVCVFLLPKSSFIKGVSIFSGVICVATSIVLGLIHYRTRTIFEYQFKSLAKEQKDSVTEYGIAKSWKVYLSKDILIQYGMFTKQIILIEDIESIQRNKGIRVMRAGVYRTSEEVDEMLLTMKKGKGAIVDTSDEIIEVLNELLAGNSIKNFSERNMFCDAEKPVEGITALALLGSAVLFMGGYSHVMNWFVPTANILDKMLFLLGYESYFWLGAVILMGICTVGTFVWRFFAQKGKKHTVMMPIWISIVLLTSMFVYVEYTHRFNEYTQNAREDYQLHQSGICEQITANRITVINEPYEAWGDWAIYEQIHDMGIELIFITIQSDEDIKSREKFLPELILLNQDIDSWDEENSYQIQYLKNTGIVVGM